MRILVVCLFLLIGAAAASDVLKLTPDNFDEEVGGDQPVLVEFFAPWCGHCKRLAPEWEIAATAFAKLPVKIAAVDADEHRSLGGRFEVRGFPTLKWFPAGSTEPEDYTGGRTADSIVDFVNKKTGMRGKIKQAPSNVVTLTPSNFDEVVMDSSKDVLVEFYAPWCGHCKQLAPKYEQVGDTFAGEEGVIIAKVDADAHRELGSRFDVQGFPTIKFFPKDNKAGEPYSGSREGEGFVNFINDKAGTELVFGGGFLPSAGRIDELDNLAASFWADRADASKAEEYLVQAQTLIDEGIEHKNAELAKFYVIGMKRVLAKGEEFVETEKARLTRMLNGASLKPEKRGQFHKRINILGAFA